MKLLYVFKSAHGVSRHHPPADFLRIIPGDKNTCASASSPSTSLIAEIGLAVSAIAQPAVPTKEMVVTPFEQVKFSYRSGKAARWNQIAVAERDPASGPSSTYLKFKKGVNRSRTFFSQRPNRFDKRPLGQGMREPDAQEAVRFGVARGKRFQRLGQHPGAQRVQTRRLYRAVEQLGTQCSLHPLHLPGNRRGRPE
jgi:hypothetical protein